ncbi:hypothetical protein [Rhizobium lusitanum]|uniref:hypothetical protein n=1 Tax=Rhizobium lusitanum TaxID=293958 RepID=UPI00195AA399|nr:hypothetical protein [Rhizobium lusitanum]MBM7046268.1 hypothetical protein [Rhizobium lusitanum]
MTSRAARPFFSSAFLEREIAIGCFPSSRGAAGERGQGEKPRGIAHRVSGQLNMFGQVLQAFEPKDGETAFCPCWGEGAEPSFPAQEKEPAGAGVMMPLQRPENVILIDIDEAGQL